MRSVVILAMCLLLMGATACKQIGSTPYESVDAAGSSTEDVRNPGYDGTTLTPDSSSSTEGSTTASRGSTTTTSRKDATDNVVDAGALFGTTAGKTGATTTTKPTTTTTIRPNQQEVINRISLPKTGYDPDGKGRIQLGEVSLTGQKVSVEVKNVSTGWITEETSYFEYTCYDKKDKELTVGKMYFGVVEVGKSKICEFTIPEGTDEVVFTGFHTDYWTEWK